MMTTAFDTFDASAKEAFVKSPLGARNTIIEVSATNALILYFTDESVVYADPPPGAEGLWDGDVEAYLEVRQLLADRGLGILTILVDYPVAEEYTSGPDAVTPPDEEVPGGVRHILRASRTESFDGIISLIENGLRSLGDTAELTFLGTIIDTSGSMRLDGFLSVLGPAVADVNRFFENDPRNIVVFTTQDDSHRWLALLAQVMRRYLIGN